MSPGTRIIHHTLGSGTVQPLIDLDNTTRRSEMYRANSILFVKLDTPPPGWHEVVMVDEEACKNADQ